MKRILLAVGRSMPGSASWGFILLAACLFSSCSYFQHRSNAQNKSAANTASEEKVSKAEYDALLAKYRQVLGNRETSTPGSAAAAGTPVPELAETVDVFNNGQVAVTPGKNAAPATKNLIVPKNTYVTSNVSQKKKASDAEIERQIKAWRQAARYFDQQKYDQALTILRPLEKSAVAQIRVRTRFLTAEILYAQHEYDLAFQVYEEIIQQDAFSSLVLPALGKLVACADKLNLTEKKEQYYSLLHDVFGETVQP